MTTYARTYSSPPGVSDILRGVGISTTRSGLFLFLPKFFTLFDIRSNIPIRRVTPPRRGWFFAFLFFARRTATPATRAPSTAAATINAIILLVEAPTAPIIPFLLLLSEGDCPLVVPSVPSDIPDTSEPPVELEVLLPPLEVLPPLELLLPLDPLLLPPEPEPELSSW